jgi:hypothetical protein
MLDCGGTQNVSGPRLAATDCRAAVARPGGMERREAELMQLEELTEVCVIPTGGTPVCCARYWVSDAVSLRGALGCGLHVQLGAARPTITP